MSRNNRFSWLNWTKRGCAVLALGLMGIQSASASPPDRPTAAKSSDDGLMTSRDVNSAPYGVRLKITGFLARQHAREGDTTRALREFHSMLSVDDPAWPDNEDGDSMRIARDMEVARMMAESGFYDHSVRVLETAHILAESNDDPQTHLVERQIESTMELAHLKGRPLPPTGPMQLHASARPLPRVSRAVAEEPADEPPARRSVPSMLTPPTGVVKTAEQVQSPERVQTAMPDLPPASPKPITHVVVVQQPPAKPPEKSLFQRFIPSRWRDKDDAASARVQPMPAQPLVAVQPQPVATQQQIYSPDVSPNYCAECATHAGTQIRQIAPPPSLGKSATDRHPSIFTARPKPVAQPQPEVELELPNADAVAQKPEVQVASAQQQKAEAKTETELAERPKRGVLNKLAARRAAKSPETAGNSIKGKQNSLITPPVVTFYDEPEPKSAVQSQSEGETGPDLKLTGLDADKSKPAAGAEATAESDSKSEELNLPAASDAGESKPGNDQDTPDVAIDDAIPAAGSHVHMQVGIAGQVANPGIFAVEGNSTTLAAVLRRAGGDSAAKKTRVLRTVELGKAGDEAGSQKDFYLQRVEVSEADAKLLATPIYGQEIVIVDGDGRRPVYVAIMPHFILQLPTAPDRPTTAHQIVEQLRVYWPNIRNQEIGVLRYEDWGRAAKVARVQDDTTSLDEALKPGDVLYVDGIGLDQEQVLSAAEAIARIVGATIRTAK